MCYWLDKRLFKVQFQLEKTSSKLVAKDSDFWPGEWNWDPEWFFRTPYFVAKAAVLNQLDCARQQFLLERRNCKPFLKGTTKVLLETYRAE